MLKIESGRARDLGIKFWEIIDSNGALLTEFSHARFPTILDGALVYFMNLDVDPSQCENVQSKAEVDEFVRIATPSGGMDQDADMTLRLFIMSALLRALEKQGLARTKYLNSLRTKLIGVAGAASPPQRRVTMALLKSLNMAS
jgi:hypothetical protein